MKQRRTGHIVALALAFQALPASAAAPVPIDLPRSAKWEIRYNPESCKLLGVFGTGEQQIMLQMNQFEPSDQFELVLFGKQIKDSTSMSFLEVGFGPGGKLQKRETTNGTSGQIPMRVVGTSRVDNQRSLVPEVELPPVPREVEKAATYLDVNAGRGKLFRLATGSMAFPMGALRKCTAELVRSWGFDPVQRENWIHGPIPANSPASWLKSNDYPAGLLMKGAMGIVHFRLDIDETGAVTKCVIQQATKPEGFDTLSCRLIQSRAKFSPAVDKDGQRVKSYYRNTVKWMIPY